MRTHVVVRKSFQARSSLATPRLTSSQSRDLEPQEYLDMGRVKKVDLYENGTIAIVEAVRPFSPLNAAHHAGPCFHSDSW